MMRVGDLFSGIGGFSLAAEWMGWETAWFSEIDPFASRVLAHHWPDVPNLGDVTRIDWSTVEPVDVLTGGFPCQPHSLAGKRLASSDERDLFDEIIRAVRVLRPRYVVLENVRGLLTSESGRFFGRVLRDLADCGYDAEWQVLSAADVGAPHRRERVWIVAHADGRGQQKRAELYREPQHHTAYGDSRGRHPDRLCVDVGHTNRAECRRISGGICAAEAERDCARCADGRCADGLADAVDAVGNANSGRREQHHESIGASREPGSRLLPVEHTTSGGRGTRDQLAVRRTDGGGAGLGDAEQQGSQGLGGHGDDGHESRWIGARPTRPTPASGGPVGWSDAVAVRGADGTVRRIPREAAEGGPESALWPVAHGVPARVAQLRGIGNSIVPQCAYEILRAIEARDMRAAA